MASWKRAKMARKKRVRPVKKLSRERRRGQLSIQQAENMAWNEKVRWKGIPRREEFEEE